MTEKTIVAIARYSRDEFNKIRAKSKDGGGLQETFDEWKAELDKHLANFTANGIKVEFVDVKADELFAWLAINKLESSAETRARYGHDVISARYANKS